MRDELLPEEGQILDWIERIFAQGTRRPGYPADRWTEEFAAECFRELGLQDVRLEPAPLPYREPRSWSLQVAGPAGEVELPCFPLPHSAPTEGLELEVRVRIRVDSVCEEITSYNALGELPGADEEIVLIGSHHDGPWPSAVEDASGVALVLAQAAYWSKLTRAERPHRLMLLLNAGHMAGSAGCGPSSTPTRSSSKASCSRSTWSTLHESSSSGTANSFPAASRRRAGSSPAAIPLWSPQSPTP